jgi:hypothetical protein
MSKSPPSPKTKEEYLLCLEIANFRTCKKDSTSQKREDPLISPQLPPPKTKEEEKIITMSKKPKKPRNRR